MANLHYVTTKEMDEAVKSIEEDKFSAVVLFMDNFGKGAKEKPNMSESVASSLELYKGIQRSLSNRVTCPIYINYINGSNTNDDYLSSIPIYDKFDIRIKALPSIVIYKNGEIIDLTHGVKDINHNGYKDLMNTIKAL